MKYASEFRNLPQNQLKVGLYYYFSLKKNYTLVGRYVLNQNTNKL